MEVHAGLLMHRDHIGAGQCKSIDVPFWVLDHQVHVDERPGAVNQRLQGSDDQRTDGDVGHEMAVHDVHVQDARAGVEHRLHVVAEVREVGRED
jgi:hypothetical protein